MSFKSEQNAIGLLNHALTIGKQSPGALLLRGIGKRMLNGQIEPKGVQGYVER